MPRVIVYLKDIKLQALKLETERFDDLPWDSLLASPIIGREFVCIV